MVDKETAKKIALALLESATMEEIAFRFAALGLNFPDRPYDRCRLVNGYVLRRKRRQSCAVTTAMLNAAKNVKDLDFPMWRLRQDIKDKVAAYAAASVDLTDQQANQIFYEMVYGKKHVDTWKIQALARYWRKRNMRLWQP